jgi:hypothetical protein
MSEERRRQRLRIAGIAILAIALVAAVAFLIFRQ